MVVISGRLVDAEGKAIPQKVIRIFGQRGGRHVSYDATGVTAPDGSFEIRGVSNDVPWRFFIPQGSGMDGVTSQPFRVGAGAHNLEVCFTGEALQPTEAQKKQQLDCNDAASAGAEPREVGTEAAPRR